MFNQDTRFMQGLAVGLALILSTLIGGLFFWNARMAGDSLSVTGSAKIQVTSDLAKVIVAVEETVPQSQLSSGYTRINTSLNEVKSFLIKNGAEADKLVVVPVSTYQVYDYNNQYSSDPRYSLRQTIEYQSNDIEKVRKMSEGVTSLAQKGILVSIQSLEYYYTKLPELRVSLLGDAIRDAQARAKQIAESSDRKVGPIKSASSGVVQVLPVNSIDVSDYGSYDTSHIEKEVMVTVKASFGVR